MRIILLTQNDPIYLAQNIDYLTHITHKRFELG